MATLARQLSQTDDRTAHIPWYLWCSALAVTSVSIGAHWDVSWHGSIGRDTFWTPAHLAIYLCGVLAGIACGYLILSTSFRGNPESRAVSVHVLGFSGPLGAFLSAWGGITMLTSAPFDNWWHNAYGLDVKIVSPPHTVLIIGIFGVEIGTLFLSMAAINRAEGNATLFRQLQGLLLYLAGMMMVLTMFFLMEYTWDISQHRSGAYIALSIAVPLYYAAVWKASRHRWAATWMTAGYTGAVSTNILHFFARVVVFTCPDRLTAAAPFPPALLIGGDPKADDQSYDHGPSSATLRPPAARACPPYPGPDHRD